MDCCHRIVNVVQYSAIKLLCHQQSTPLTRAVLTRVVSGFNGKLSNLLLCGMVQDLVGLAAVAVTGAGRCMRQEQGYEGATHWKQQLTSSINYSKRLQEHGKAS